MRTLACTAVALLVLCAASGLLHAQDPDTVWTHTYGAASDDGSYSVQQTADGGYIIAGYTDVAGDAGYEIYLVKTDPMGDTIWTSVIEEDLMDCGRSVQQTQDGGFVVVGYTNSYGILLLAYMIKTDSRGQPIWKGIYGGSYNDAAYCVDQTGDGGYIFAGYSYSFGISMTDMWLVKTDSLGDQEWWQVFGRDWDDRAWSVQATSDGGYILCGDMGEPYGSQLCVIKTDGIGNSIWMNLYWEGGDSHGRSVQETSDGCYIVTGYTHNFANNSTDVCLLKIDTQGDTVWTRMYGGSNTDRGFSVQETTDGGFIIAGNTWSYGGGYQDIYLIKTDAQGETLWTRSYGGAGYEAAYAVQQTQDGGYVVTGYTASIGAGGNDAWLLKLGPETGITEQPERVISPGAIMLTASPNPFTAGTSIKVLGTRKGEHQDLCIYDVSGRMLRSFFLEPSNSGLATEILWDGRDEEGREVQQGVYFLKMGGKQAGKVVKVR